MRKICVVSGSRADYWLLKPVILKLDQSKKISLKVVLTGAHLINRECQIWDDLNASGITDIRRIDCVIGSDEPVAVTKSLGVGMIGFADLLHILSPDLVVVLGDRYEILAAVSACLLFGIPVGHIHGGEVTIGAFDDAIRHSVTKMSHLHFVSTEKYRERVIQLGENPDNIFNCGSLGVENIKNTVLISRENLEKKLQIKFQKVNILITFHPVTLGTVPNITALNELLHSVSKIPDACLIFTSPNVDPEGNLLRARIIDFVKKNQRHYFFESMGATNYFSMLKQVDCVLGNSSSGIIEASSLGVGSINIGERQDGREMPDSVISCAPVTDEIDEALKKVLSKDFRSSICIADSMYEGDRTSEEITKVLERFPLKKITQKKFFDLDRIVT
ncbi:MAG: UDP-N-acetylglucosamine 2-epimerase (hydrolyzing) [Gammaproteobacteria bacterium]|nr:UDP-N-acetylglucosamine 2-epimerase (hydrolyzing) [Gammaproteobacteria bacterium]|tara:strand:- start:59 stop:1225 length:1167 start_codon:yes stop_codon:yes gene_type:complete